MPSVVWHGLAPFLDGVRNKPLVPSLDGWGGMLTSEDDVARALWVLDPALVMVNLAGYQVLEVAIGIPNGAVATDARDLIAVDMTTMEVDRGTARPLTPLAGQAHVSLWIEPRFAAAPAGPPSLTLDLDGLAEALDADAIAIPFAATGTGWLQLTWFAGQTVPAWLDQLGLEAEVLVQALIGQLALYHAAAAGLGDGPVTCGLLGVYDSRTWSIPFPIEPEQSPLLPGVGAFGQRLGEIIDGDPFGFLAEEVAVPGPTSLDRWEEGLSEAELGLLVEDLGLCADELGGLGLDGAVADDERAQEFARAAYAAFIELPVTPLLFLWQSLGVLDFLGFASGQQGGVVIDDGAGGRAPLAHGWVYLRDDESGAVTVLATDATGHLMSTPGPVRDAPWDYIDDFVPEPGAELSMAFSRGARPVPDRLVTDPELESWFTSVTVPMADTAPIVLPETHIAVTMPKELELWPLLWVVSAAVDDPYLTEGLDQGAAAWTGNHIDVDEGLPAAPLAPGAVALPRLRGLIVQGSVDARADGVGIELAAVDGTAIALRRDLQANAPQVTRVTAALGRPGGATRTFDATVVLDPAVLPQRFGAVQIVVVRHGLDGSRVEAISELLTGVQLALVDDPAPPDRGPVPRVADEKVVVDFKKSPQATLGALQGQTRVRRMVEYDLAIGAGLLDPALPANADTNPNLPKPRMPRWMAEAQLAGADRAALRDLMRRRAFRAPAPPGGGPPPEELAIALDWTLHLEWDGSDGNAASFAGSILRPDQHHNYAADIPGTQQVVLRFDEAGEVLDTHGLPAVLGAEGELPGALPDESRPAFVEDGRRRPHVLLDRTMRAWGRSGGGQAPCLVVEWQPILAGAGGVEMVRGGNGKLTLEGLSLHGTSVSMGRVLSGARVVGAGAPPARVPDFRIVGVTPPVDQRNAMLDALVLATYTRLRLAGAAPGTVLLTVASWQAVMPLVATHESGGRQFDTDLSRSLRYGGLYFGLEFKMPLFGPPHGYGIGQIDLPAATDDQVWSFLANADAGVRLLLGEKAAAAYNVLSAHKPGVPDDRFRAVLQRQAVRAYNGSTEFVWDAPAAAWKIRPGLGQWKNAADHGQGPHPNLTYPNLVMGTGVVYYTSAAGAANVPDGENTVFNWPITFDAADFGPLVDQIP